MTWASPSGGIASCGFSLPAGSGVIWDNANTTLSTVYFRKNFNLASLCSTASIQVRADDVYTLYINGTQVSPSVEPNYNVMNTYDITPYLVCGNNIIAARVKDIHPNGCRYFAATAFFTAPAVPLNIIAQAFPNVLCEGANIYLSSTITFSNPNLTPVYQWTNPSGTVISNSAIASVSNATLFNREKVPFGLYFYEAIIDQNIIRGKILNSTIE